MIKLQGELTYDYVLEEDDIDYIKERAEIYELDPNVIDEEMIKNTMSFNLLEQATVPEPYRKLIKETIWEIMEDNVCHNLQLNDVTLMWQ